MHGNSSSHAPGSIGARFPPRAGEAITCEPRPRHGSPLLPGPAQWPYPDPTGNAQSSHRPGGILEPERLLRAAESHVIHLRAPYLPRLGNPRGWRCPRHGPRASHPSCAGTDPHPQRELSAGRRRGGCRVTAPQGVSTRGVQSEVPAPPKLAQDQPCSFSCLYCFFPLQLVGFLINSQISFGHRSWGWKKPLSEVDFANQHWPSQTSSGGISIGAPNNRGGSLLLAEQIHHFDVLPQLFFHFLSK